MTSSFDLNNDGVIDANDTLRMHVNSAGQILSELRSVLLGISQATHGKATPLWEELQKQWQASYTQMSDGLTLKHQASVAVHDRFTEGDNLGARIMMG